jgi:hypothetical protein
MAGLRRLAFGWTPRNDIFSIAEAHPYYKTPKLLPLKVPLKVDFWSKFYYNLSLKEKS